MPITAVIMTFFGLAVMYDENKHKKERKPVSNLFMTLIGIISLLYGIVNFLQVIGAV